MNVMVRSARKNGWNIYLLLHIMVFIIIRICTPYRNGTVLDAYTDMYYERRVLGINILGYFLLLGPMCKNMLTSTVAISCGTHEEHILLLVKKIIFRAVSYSFVLNILYYLIVGMSADDWMLKENIIRTGLLFLTQLIGWCVTGFLYLVIYICSGHVLLTVCLSYLCMILLHLSNYVNCYEQLQYYIRLYYLMFHIEVYPSFSCLISATILYFIVGLLLCIASYKKLQKKEYL